MDTSLKCIYIYIKYKKLTQNCFLKKQKKKQKRTKTKTNQN